MSTSPRGSADAPPDASATHRAASVVERHSIEVVPVAERHGRTWHLGTLWFMVNAQLTALAVGFIGPEIGASFFTSIAGIVAGALFGTFFMAFHSAQGPHLGLPQMIQSRAQFGFLGVLLPMVFVVLMLLGFNIFNLQLIGQAAAGGTGEAAPWGVIGGGVLAVVLAVVGYRALHAAERWLAYPFLLLFGVLTVAVPLHVPLSAGQFAPSSFSGSGFLVMFGLVSGWQLAWAPYVSDYSRYLKPSVGHVAPFAWTYTGSSVAAIWLIGLGSYLGTAYPKLSPVRAVIIAGDTVFHGFGMLVAIYSVLGLVAVSAVNLYTASITLLSMADSIRALRPTRAKRIAAVAAGGGAGLLLALFAPGQFLDNFHNFLLLLLYFMIPWTAVNLVDYYLLRRGEYDVGDLLRRYGGQYGRWSAAGLTAYLAGFAVMVPFFSVPGLYVGPVAEALGEADLSAFVGLGVSAGLYVALARRARRRGQSADV
ncbi:purine-cytosine permease family protein [Amycolatopsis benzoatilytica]|uniref:purine-cytosine permease family protein n=1 Tax=Amycolatopsis benzoatilytica TaxID=346045 RepID=UPI00037A7B23|nr:cytosine permease [Amycolatopsis benzoatilytica]